MIAIDQKTKDFYLSMGYSDTQIQIAYTHSKQSGIDILDALNMNQEPVAPPPPAKQNELSSQTASYAYRNNLSFLTPWKRVKHNDYEILFSRNNKHQSSSTKTELREENYPVGLLNVSNCCYLNSLLQCYFLMNDFKTAIFTAEPLANLEQTLAHQTKTKVKRIKNEYELLSKFKQFFTTMALTSKKYLDPTFVLDNLVDSVGEKISYGEEKDLSEINVLIIERLSEGLTYSKNHYQPPESESLLDQDITREGSTIIQNESNNRKRFNSIFNPRQGAIKQLFYGTQVEYYDDQSMQKEPPIVSDFTGIILNPRAGSLYKALDQQFNFQVEINGGFQKKTTFIRDEPEYLFMYINRTEFDREEGQAMKNQHKFTFDFTIYLDRYLEKYRKKHDQAYDRIQELQTSKNKLTEQINHLQILFKKIEECQSYAHSLEGWSDRLPKEEEFEEEYDRLEGKLKQVEKELNQIESRKEQYHLMYIFVHRGDAVSGHYWGYGRNEEQWYRFDINTRKIIEEQIIIDLEKSAATPYALLYVKETSLPKFDYRIHQDDSILREKYPKTDFRGCFNPTLVNEIVSQNVTLRQDVLLKNNNLLRDKTFNEYLNRLTSLKKIVTKEDEERENRHLAQLEICNNFSLFLWSKDEHELCKFTLFEQALFNASGNRYTVQRLMHDLDLLHLIQKKFKKNLKGEFYLKFYSLLPKEIEKLEVLYQEYQINSFEVIWGSVVLNQAELYQDEWTAKVSSHTEGVFEPSESIKSRVLRLLRLLKIRNGLFKDENFKKALRTLPEPLYITQMNNEMVKLLLFSISLTGFKIDSLQQFSDISDQIGAQIISLNAGNDFCLGKNQDTKSSPIEKAVDFISKFNSMLQKKTTNKRSTIRSAAKISEMKKEVITSGFKNSILTSSPGKINSLKKVESKEEWMDFGLVTTIASVLVLQGKDSWGIEELESVKINYELGPKLLIFLKKLGVLPKVFKKILRGEKSMTLGELRGEGLFVNQKENGEDQEKKEEKKVEKEDEKKQEQKHEKKQEQRQEEKQGEKEEEEKEEAKEVVTKAEEVARPEEQSLI